MDENLCQIDVHQNNFIKGRKIFLSSLRTVTSHVFTLVRPQQGHKYQYSESWKGSEGAIERY